MEIKRIDSQPSNKASEENFTGTVYRSSLAMPTEPGRASVGRVTFEPGARSAWHSHPLGQVLIVTEGTGWIQEWGGTVEEIKEGDVVYTPPGKKHWHGATPKTRMTHLTIQEMLNGEMVEWMEKVSDDQYRK